MLVVLSHISTWLFIEMIATLILIVLNMIIPMLMVFTSYRNLVNFYFSSTALSSALINCLYLFYLIQTLRLKDLSEINCRAIYYLQTSCIVVLAYTVAAMHANFVLCLFPSFVSVDQDRSTRTCLQSCGRCLRRFFRRFCFCFVLCVWSVSFTSTIPLLYTIDSNEKSPKPVYCPGTEQISYLEEWFDRNRITQTVVFNLSPLLISLLLSIIALLKLFYDCLIYLYHRLKMSKCSPCRRTSSSDQPTTSMLSSAGTLGNPIIQNGLHMATTGEMSASVLSANLTIQSYRRWFSTSFLRFILVLSCCLLACIYPIVMRFYLIYFSVLVPLIFAVLNYSLGPLATPPQTTIENPHVNRATPSASSLNVNLNNLLQTKPILKSHERDTSLNEQVELRSPLINNLVNEREQSSQTPSPSLTITGKRMYFSNHLYENTRNMFKR